MNSSRTDTLTIRTPEGIYFSFRLASPFSRFLAYLVDWAVIAALLSIIDALISVLKIIDVGLSASIATLIYFVVQIGSLMVCEWLWRGQTLGKRMLQLRVVDAAGLRLQFSQLAIRNLLRVVDMLPGFYLLGGTVAWFSPRNQRLGDIAANTIVIRNPKVEQPDLEQILAGKFNSFRAHPHLEGRLRQKVSPLEAGLALQALVRRDEFEAAARPELFARLAAHYQTLVEFPAEATLGLTDEQYLRNVVDTLFRPRTRKPGMANQPPHTSLSG